MKDKLYFFTVLLFLFIFTPLILSAVVIAYIFIVSYTNATEFIVFFVVSAVVLLALVLCYRMWRYFVNNTELPKSVFERYLPFAAMISYHIIIWIIMFIVTGYDYANNFEVIAVWSSAPYLLFNIYFSFVGKILYILIFPCAVIAVSAVLFTVAYIRNKKKPENYRGIITLPSVVLALTIVILLQIYYRSTLYIDVPYDGSTYETVRDDIELQDYLPYEPKSRLEVFEGTPNVIISRDYPKLDGATAAYPVYAAVAQAVYEGLGKNSIEHFAMCSKTDGAYEKLIKGEVDIIFAAQPSEQQINAAKEKGIELKLTPVAREAFVFTVNQTNPVNNLTIKQIQDIYTRKITNWKEVGGDDTNIIPFQRPENSGSQTIMLAAVMKDKKLPPPLKTEYAASMGGLVTQVADYKNYPASIGYSFRFFATEMNKGANIKLLSIEGIQPSVENISSGIYPFTVDVYAVTAGTKNVNSELLIDWILSEQGQNFIEQCGYVRLGE